MNKVQTKSALVDGLSDVYAVKKENAQEWESLGVIDDIYDFYQVESILKNR